MKYIDTHAHLISDFFESDPKETIKKAFDCDVDKIILPGTNIKDSLANIKFAEENKGVYAMIGIHPSDSRDYEKNYFDKVDVNKIVAVGEVGFDFYRAENPDFKVQEKCFVDHIEFALRHDKPIVIHMRNAEAETYYTIRKYAPLGLKFLLHSCTSSKEWVQKFIDLGAYVSMSGIVTFKNATLVREAAKIIPEDKLLTETDSPFLAPMPKRGKVNQPAYVKYVTEYLKEFLNDDELPKKVYQNAIDFFGL